VRVTEDGKAHVFEAATGRAVGRPLGQGVERAWLGPGGRRLVAARGGGGSGWGGAPGTPPRGPVQGGKDLRLVELSAGGRHLLTLGGEGKSEGAVRLWRLDGAEGPRVLSHPVPVHHAAFRPDGLALATACEDGIVRVWRVAGGKEEPVG